jgi:diadenosine tetraphosphate (Ap4A) HIT family hydrolase
MEAKPGDSCPMVTPKPCVFCERIRNGEVLAANDLACAFRDAFPVSPGHTLIVPRDHVARYSELASATQEAMWTLARAMMGELQANQRPDGFNLGINDGEAAGQTIGHAHLHVIPRFQGDVDDARGGVRWVVPRHAKYWRD